MSSASSYLQLILSDGNLPTGSFVSSSGLESYFKHGFPALSSNPTATATATVTTTPKNIEALVAFVKDSAASYARLTLAFVSDAHSSVRTNSTTTPSILKKLKTLDDLCDNLTLNHISRRASKAQGVALLTLYSKGFKAPDWIHQFSGQDRPNQTLNLEDEVIDSYKLLIRKGESSGHLPVCWGVLTAALGMPLEESQHLFLFLYVRSLLSAAIRLNILGPYASQQLLLHVVQPIVQEEASKCAHLRTRAHEQKELPAEPDWAELESNDGPATTWPLGEILAGRHDLQHSRIFNS